MISSTPPDTTEPVPGATRRVRSRAWSALAVGAVAVGSVGVLAVRDPNATGSYGFCPFRALTGWDCPFCGGLRGTYALLHGDVPAALDHNILLPGLLVAIAVIGWRWWRGSMPSWPTASRGTRFWVVAPIVLLCVFWVARNLPMLSYLRSGTS